RIGGGDAGVDLAGEELLDEELAPQAVAQLRIAQPLLVEQGVEGLAGVLGAQAQHRAIDLRLVHADALLDGRPFEELAIEQLLEQLALAALPPRGILERGSGHARLGGQGRGQFVGRDRLAPDDGHDLLILPLFALFAGPEADAEDECAQEGARATTQRSSSAVVTRPSPAPGAGSPGWGGRWWGRRRPPNRPAAWRRPPRRPWAWSSPADPRRRPRRPWSASRARCGSRSCSAPTRRSARR